MRTLMSLFLLVALSSCGEDMDPGVDGAIASCDCEPESAAETSYNNTGSGLPGDNVQDALDDVAARTDPAGDAFARVSLASASDTSSAGDPVSVGVACPVGQLALGGACDTTLLNGSLYRTILLESGFQCHWNNPDGEIGATLTVTATCLAPPAQ